MNPEARRPSQVFRRVLDAIAIVASILLAFGIDAAWQERGERREELRILAALHDEFAVNQERLAGIVAFHADLKATAHALMEAARDPASLPADSIDRMITNVSWWGGFITFESAALDAVVLGGQLDLIRDERLRRLLTAWRRDVAVATAQEAQEFEHYSHVWMPMLRNHANLAQIGNATTTIPGSREAYSADRVPVVLGGVDHRQLLRDRGFQNALVQKVWIEDDVLRAYRHLEPQVEELLRALEQAGAWQGT